MLHRGVWDVHLVLRRPPSWPLPRYARLSVLFCLISSVLGSPTWTDTSYGSVEASVIDSPPPPPSPPPSPPPPIPATVTTILGVAWASGSVDGLGTNARFTDVEGLAIDPTNCAFVRALLKSGSAATVLCHAVCWPDLDGGYVLLQHARQRDYAAEHDVWHNRVRR
jgi:hypothetical protein